MKRTDWMAKVLQAYRTAVVCACVIWSTGFLLADQTTNMASVRKQMWFTLAMTSQCLNWALVVAGLVVFVLSLGMRRNRIAAAGWWSGAVLLAAIDLMAYSAYYNHWPWPFA